MITLRGKRCVCTLANGLITVEGSYYRYEGHRRKRAAQPLAVPISQVLRLDETKTYSRRMLAIPMCFGFLALFIKSIPVLGLLFPVIPDVYYTGLILWRLPFQLEAWSLCAILCLLTVPLYLLSYRRDLELNTMLGRFLLPERGMDKAHISAFQQAFSAQRANKRT